MSETVKRFAVGVFFLGEDICGCLSTINWEMYGYLSHKKAVVSNLMISNNDIYGCLAV